MFLAFIIFFKNVTSLLIVSEIYALHFHVKLISISLGALSMFGKLSNIDDLSDHG